MIAPCLTMTTTTTTTTTSSRMMRMTVLLTLIVLVFVVYVTTVDREMFSTTTTRSSKIGTMLSTTLKPSSKSSNSSLSSNSTSTSSTTDEGAGATSSSSPSTATATATTVPSTTPDILHVIHSRFQQNQANLTHLGLARLELFESITLPSLVQQTSHNNLVYLIFVDPQLHNGALLDKLIASIQREMVVLDNNNNNNNNNNTNQGLKVAVIGANSSPTIFLHNVNEYILNQSMPILYETHRGILQSLFLLHTTTTTDSSSNREEDNNYIDTATTTNGSTSSSSSSSSRSSATTTATSPLLLETRLDADDALSLDFVETVQKIAMQDYYGKYLPQLQLQLQQQQGQGQQEQNGTVLTRDNNNTDGFFEFYCIFHNMEWKHDNPIFDDKDGRGQMTNPGFLTVDGVRKGPKRCVTPGLTMAYTPELRTGVRDWLLESENMLKHTQIHKNFRSCEKNYIAYNNSNSVNTGNSNNTTATTTKRRKIKYPCLHRIYKKWQGDLTEGKKYYALRGRTITSAGMRRVELSEEERLRYSKQQDQLWQDVGQAFGISKSRVSQMRAHVESNKDKILEEALIGQCTEGHSCKDTSKEILQGQLEQLRQEEHKQKQEVKSNKHEPN